jgi:hypothetical protein
MKTRNCHFSRTLRPAAALWCNIAAVVACLVAVALITGCASTTVSNQQSSVTGQLPVPGNILVYPFVAIPSEVPADSAMAGKVDPNAAPLTDQQIAEGRKLGGQISAELVAQIKAMGMPAQEVPTGTRPQINDLLIRGFLVSIQNGSAAERVAIGFGTGASELRTVVEGYQMTAQGLVKLGSGTVNSGGSKGPGSAVGAATFLATANPAGLIVSSGIKVYGEESGSSTVEGRAKATAKEIADVLKQRFQAQGWIN